MINGEMTHKGSAAHEAAITGDTVGDPFKDTSGPSMNILIKLTCLIGLVIAPILGGHSAEANLHKQTIEVTANMTVNEDSNIERKVDVNIAKNKNGTIKSVVSYSVTENGITIKKEKVFEGTEEEVETATDAFLNENVDIDSPNTPETPDTSL
jgi:K(+)-stimulated pyrophosphate-energized sodium pump